MPEIESAALTRAQILAMPAGPEMDALVAERVFHQSVTRVPVYGGTPRCYVQGPTAGSIADFIPAYSTDASAMMDVIENRRSTGWYPAIELISDDEWECLLYLPKRDAQTGAFADTMPLAVCRAALLTTLEA